MLAKEQALQCAAFALDKKAFDVKILDVSGISSLTDYLVFANGNSDRQVQAICESVRIGLKTQGEMPLGIEGESEGRWVLLDYGNVMVHIFQPSVREFYDLDGLWSEAPQVDLPSDKAVG